MNITSERRIVHFSQSFLSEFKFKFNKIGQNKSYILVSLDTLKKFNGDKFKYFVKFFLEAIGFVEFLF